MHSKEIKHDKKVQNIQKVEKTKYKKGDANNSAREE
jgi:hypothetical protein